MDTIPGESSAYLLGHDEYANVKVLGFEFLPEMLRVHIIGDAIGMLIDEKRNVQIEIKAQMPLIGDLQYGFRL